MLRVKTASIRVTDIPSFRNPAKILGSLVYSDVFIDSVIQVQKEGKNMYIHMCKSDVKYLSKNLLYMHIYVLIFF